MALRYLGHEDEEEEGWTIHLLPPSDSISLPLLREPEPLVPLDEEPEGHTASSDEP